MVLLQIGWLEWYTTGRSSGGGTKFLLRTRFVSWDGSISWVSHFIGGTHSSYSQQFFFIVHILPVVSALFQLMPLVYNTKLLSHQDTYRTTRLVDLQSFSNSILVVGASLFFFGLCDVKVLDAKRRQKQQQSGDCLLPPLSYVSICVYQVFFLSSQ